MSPGHDIVIVRAEIAADLARAAHLFDHELKADAVERFTADPEHHLLLALEGNAAVGFVSGIEMTHPDKGTEMFLYELAVDEGARNRGVGRSLVAALADAGPRTRLLRDVGADRRREPGRDSRIHGRRRHPRAARQRAAQLDVL